MIILDNCAKCDTYICVNDYNFKIVDAKDTNGSWQGIGGVDVNGNVLGIYVENGVLNLLYNNKSISLKEKKVVCCNEWFKNTNKKFVISIQDKIIYEVEYKPYISPLALAFEEDDDEFDVYQSIFNILSNQKKIEGFIKGMNSIS